MNKKLRTDKIIEILENIKETTKIEISQKLKIKFLKILKEELKQEILNLKTMKDDLNLLNIEILKEIQNNIDIFKDTGHNVIDRENHLIGKTLNDVIIEKEKQTKNSVLKHESIKEEYLQIGIDY